jgi:glycosyltransferase involved in cell wall biosynthesis
MAVGTPVVASDCPGGQREIVEGCPMAWLVPPCDPKALAETIVSVCNSNVKKSQAGASVDAFLNRFDVKSVVRAYEDLLQA